MPQHEDSVSEKEPDRRRDDRQDFSLEVSLPNQNGKTINISEGGVCFEVITNNVDSFAIGATIPVQITAIITTPDSKKGKLKLRGEGLIIRNDIKEVTHRGSKLDVAVKFKHKLDTLIDES